MNEKGTNCIVQCAKHALGFAVLSGCVGARSAEQDATTSKEGSIGIIEELDAIICLKTAHRRTKPCVSISNKLNNMIMNFRFMAKGIRPTIMSIIINQHKITRNTRNWRGPDITVNEFKRC